MRRVLGVAVVCVCCAAPISAQTVEELNRQLTANKLRIIEVISQEAWRKANNQPQ